MPRFAVAFCVALCLGVSSPAPEAAQWSTPAQIPMQQAEQERDLAAGSFTADELATRLAANPEDTDARHALARAYLRAGEIEAADREFRALLARDPDNADWLLGCGQSLLALGRPEEAALLLERARSTAPAYEDVWRVELAALEAADRTARAVDLLDRAVLQFPGSDWPVTRRHALRERELLRRGTRASLSSSYEHLSDGKGEWRTLALDFDRPLRRALRLFFGLHAEERFGQRDEQLAVGLLRRSGQGWTAAIAGDLSPGATVLPQSSLQLEIGRPVAGSLSFTARARHARHATVDVDVLVATLESGRGSYRAAYTLAATRPSDLETSFGHSVRLSRDYGTGSHVNLALAHGEEAETVAPGQVLVTRNTTIALHGIHWRSAAWGAAWEIAYHEQGDLYHRLRFRLGLEHRF